MTANIQPVPSTLIARQVRDIELGDEAWVDPREVTVTVDGFAFIYNASDVYSKCQSMRNLRLERNEDGTFTASWGPHKQHVWAPSGYTADELLSQAARYTPITVWA